MARRTSIPNCFFRRGPARCGCWTATGSAKCRAGRGRRKFRNGAACSVRPRAGRWARMKTATAACGSIITATDFFISRRMKNFSGSPRRTICRATAWARGSRAATAASGWAWITAGWHVCATGVFMSSASTKAWRSDRRCRYAKTIRARSGSARRGGGLCRWTNGIITRYTVGASASANFIFSISPRADGGAWLSAAEGEDLFQFYDGQIRRVSWDVHGIKSMLTDHQGRVWMGTKYGIAFSSGRERRILGTNENATLPAVRALAETPDGNVWAGADDGTIYHCEPTRLTAFRPKDALAEQPIYSMTADATGTLWAGTFRGGLLRIRPRINGLVDGGINGKKSLASPQSTDPSIHPSNNPPVQQPILEFSRITASNGLPVDVISQILDDQHGRLWLGTHQGIYCVAKSALNACANGPTNTLDYVTYGRHDGLPALECSDLYQPACWRGADGKLWFTTVRGVVSVNPEELTAKAGQPPVIIEELAVDA